MRRLDADSSRRPTGVRGDSPRAAWIFAQAAIQGYERRYNETKLPVFVLEALFWALRTGEPNLAVAWAAVPTWVMEYFSRVTTRTHATFTSRTPPKKPQNAMYQALEFTPATNSPVRVLVDDFHDQHIAYEVLPRVERGETPDHVFEAVAGEHPTKCYLIPKCKKLHWSTVRRIWKRYGPALQANCAELRRLKAHEPPPTTTLKAIEEKYLGTDAADKVTVDFTLLHWKRDA